MASLHFQNIAEEKANAMRCFLRKQNIVNIVRFFNVFAALFLFSRSSYFAIAIQTLCYLSAELKTSLFNHSFYAFLLGNAIIFCLHSLARSRHQNGGSNADDAYDYFLNNRGSRLVTASQVTLNNDPEEFAQEKQTPVAMDPSKRHEAPEKQAAICSQVADYSPVLCETAVTAVTGSTMTATITTCCTTVGRTANGAKVSEKNKRHRRVQSESFERRVLVGESPRRELKRLNTDLGREPERRLCHVEELSTDEFNRTVEDFIAKHKRMQWEEQMRSQITECLALTQ